MNKNKWNSWAMLIVLAVMMNFGFSQDFGGYGPGPGGPGFYVDENGDGFNDNAPDADGDGIPNGMDEDFVHGEYSEDAGFGPGAGDCTGPGEEGSQFRNRRAQRGGFGPGDGSGSFQPGDGTGFGPGDCTDDGQNPRGSNGHRRGGRG